MRKTLGEYSQCRVFSELIEKFADESFRSAAAFFCARCLVAFEVTDYRTANETMWLMYEILAGLGGGNRFGKGSTRLTDTFKPGVSHVQMHRM